MRTLADEIVAPKFVCEIVNGWLTMWTRGFASRFRWGVSWLAVSTLLLGLAQPTDDELSWPSFSGPPSLGRVVSSWVPAWVGSAWSFVTDCQAEPSGVAVAPPSTVYGTGAELAWETYENPCADEPETELSEYQVHRATKPLTAPSAATLIAPLPAGTTSYVDTTADPTPAEAAEEMATTYYYRVVVKTASGELVPGPERAVQVPKAGQVARMSLSESSDPVLDFVDSPSQATYFAPYTPARMVPGNDYTVEVTLTNTTNTTWPATDRVLSYHWHLPDGTDVTTGGNRLETKLPADLEPGDSVTVDARVRAPIQSDSGNKREHFVLNWDLLDTSTNTWLSDSDGIPPLAQDVTVEDPTSDQLGLEQYYQYVGKNTGAGTAALVNLFDGNLVWSYDALSNPSRGLATFVRMAYNSHDTSDSAIGQGWSLTASSLHRLGTPLDFHPRGQDYPRQVTLTDGDGTSHTFELNTHDSRDPADWTYDRPSGVRLRLDQHDGAGARAWVMTKPDRTQFFFDEDGYLSAIADNNGNELTLTYEHRRSANKPVKFLAHITDPAGRQTLTLDYYAKGDDYELIDDDGERVAARNLTNPHIIDKVRSVTDVSGRTIQLTYTKEGLLGEMVDGAGDPQAKVFQFRYDMEQGNKNVKLVEVTDPRGNATELSYYEAPEDPKRKWWLRAITDRVGGQTHFEYVDPDGSPEGPAVEATVTDAKGNATTYLMDDFGRPVRVSNAKDELTRLGWDADNNVVRLEEDNGAVHSWTYDPLTGYPTSIIDPKANANGTPGSTLDYQTDLDGHIAELTAKTSPKGRRWEFGYDERGNLIEVTDPKGTATGEGHTTTYTYDEVGRLDTETDANGNTTTYDDYHPSGYPETIIDALGNATTFSYDERGNVVAITDANEATSSYGYDVFGRPLEVVRPLDHEAGQFIVTPPPVYDANDNVVQATAPNGATNSHIFNAADQVVSMLAPPDEPDDPQRRTSFDYDRVGNLTRMVEPKGNLPSAEPGSFTTTYRYDEIYQLISVVNAEGHEISYEYDNVGNLVTIVDPRKNTSGDPEAATTRYTHDLAHRVTSIIDAAGHAMSFDHDLDGLVTATTDQEGNTTVHELDERGAITETRVPHDDDGDGIVHHTTRYEYDEVGNQTRVVTPRGVEAADPDAFVHETVYDELNRVVEEIFPYDPADPDFDTPNRVTYDYDEVGYLTTVSAPPSAGQTVRNETKYTHFNTGWVRSATDPWGIVTSYRYNELGDQTERTITSAGGSSQRTMGWSYFPDGKLAARSDEGVPAGLHVVLADNSDVQNTETTGEWTSVSDDSEFFGIDYQTAPAGAGEASFTWNLVIPADGTYEVEVRYPQVDGAATDAAFTVAHDGGEDTVVVDQDQNTGEWVSLGEYEFTDGGEHHISLSDDADGTVVADAVKLVRDNSDDEDTVRKTFTYDYDANGNLVEITDGSAGAMVDTYQVGYDGLNRAATVTELAGGTAVNTTSYTYDQNGNLLTRTHDDQHSEYTYDERDLVATITNADSVSDPDPKVTTFGYHPRGQRAQETKPNGNIVTYTYYLDGLPRTQRETKADQATVVSSHELSYSPNGHRVRDVATVMDADDHASSLSYTADYSYDPRDRITDVIKTDTATGATLATETYTYDANSNVISQVVNGATTTYDFDRNRLLTTTAGGVTAGYNYDPFGRLNTVTSAGQHVARYGYDGFDRMIEHRALDASGASTTTAYTYDPLDRTRARTDNAGSAEEETTEFTYLGLSEQLIGEHIEGEIQRSYQYTPWGQRLSQVTFSPDGGREESYYGYQRHADVETLTDEGGDTRATYGYTAYGADDENLFTGVDVPDPGDPSAEPYNVYRFSAKRLDPASGTYDMGFRQYDPGLNRFLARDMYNGALSDLGLSMNPWTMNRYAFAGGNPISLIEQGGHAAVCAPDGYNLCPDISLEDQARLIQAVAEKSRPEITETAGGNVIEQHPGGVTVVDGYVLPGGAPPVDPFLEAYERAATEVGDKTGDPFENAIIWATYACELLAADPNRQNHCTMEFKGMLQMDYDAHNFGALLPSYIGGEIGYYSDQNRDWSEEDYELWLEMLRAEGVDKRNLQRQLHQRGILHQPEGPKDLPWNPVGAVGSCAVGAAGVSTAIGVYQGVRSGGGWRGAVRAAPRAGAVGCVAGVVGYSTPWW